MPGNPSIRFTVRRCGGAVEASLHLLVRLGGRLAGRVTAPAPVLQDYLDLPCADRGRRSRWIVDIGIGGTSRPAVIRAAVAVAVTIRHVMLTSGPDFVILARGEVADALGDMSPHPFAG